MLDKRAHCYCTQELKPLFFYVLHQKRRREIDLRVSRVQLRSNTGGQKARKASSAVVLGVTQNETSVLDYGNENT